jgi:hypothetical protein
MKKNMGSPDRIIRIVLAVLFAALYFTNVVTGTLGIILLVLGVVLPAYQHDQFLPAVCALWD